MPGVGQNARSECNYLSAEAALRTEFNKALTDVGAVALNSGALAITGVGSTTAKVVAAVECIIAGVLSVIAAATNMAVLAGTILQNNFGGWVFTWDGATLRSRFMTQGATLAAVRMPAIPAGEAIIGFVRLNPTAAPFVGGTTALDAANTNAIYRDGPMHRVAMADPTNPAATGQAGLVTSPVG